MNENGKYSPENVHYILVEEDAESRPCDAREIVSINKEGDNIGTMRENYS